MATFWRCNKAGAIPHFTQHLKSNPRDFDCWLFRGISYSIIGKNQNAVSDVQQAARVGNECERLIANSFLQSNPDDSLRMKKEATQKYPNDGTGWYWYAGNDKLSQAERMAAYKKCIDLQYKYAPECHFQIGILLAEQGKRQEAIQSFETSLSGNPDRTVCHINLGFALLETGQTDAARRHFEKAKTLNPVLIDANFGLFKLYEQQGNYQAAWEQLITEERSKVVSKYKTQPPHGKTQVLQQYAPIHAYVGPLNVIVGKDGELTEHFKNFLGGSYACTTPVTKIELYRRFGGAASALGQYWTSEPRGGDESFRYDAAIPHTFNALSESTSIIVPRGIYLYEGYCAPQKTYMEDRHGGGWQVFIPYTVVTHLLLANEHGENTAGWDAEIKKARSEQEKIIAKFVNELYK